jgi:hypothetical protein
MAVSGMINEASGVLDTGRRERHPDRFYQCHSTPYRSLTHALITSSGASFGGRRTICVVKPSVISTQSVPTSRLETIFLGRS